MRQRRSSFRPRTFISLGARGLHALSPCRDVDKHGGSEASAHTEVTSEPPHMPFHMLYRGCAEVSAEAMAQDVKQIGLDGAVSWHARRRKALGDHFVIRTEQAKEKRRHPISGCRREALSSHPCRWLSSLLRNGPEAPAHTNRASSSNCTAKTSTTHRPPPIVKRGSPQAQIMVGGPLLACKAVI